MDLDLMRELWKGLKKKALQLQGISYHHYSIRNFKDELIQHAEEAGYDWKRNWDYPYILRNKFRLGNYYRTEPKPEKDWRPDKDKPMDDKRKAKPSEKGLQPCQNCGGDYFHSECPKQRSKSYLVNTKEENKHSEAENDETSAAEEDDLRSESTMTSYNIRTSCNVSFAESQKVLSAADIEVVELPVASSVGGGASFLNGTPLPLEVWLDKPGADILTVLRCGDSGEQWLIASNVVPPYLVRTISTHPTLTPSFGRIGGTSEKGRGYVVLPVFFPDENALLGR